MRHVFIYLFQIQKIYSRMTCLNSYVITNQQTLSSQLLLSIKNWQFAPSVYNIHTQTQTQQNTNLKRFTYLVMPN